MRLLNKISRSFNIQTSTGFVQRTAVRLEKVFENQGATSQGATESQRLLIPLAQQEKEESKLKQQQSKH